ncbi:hypothetical protein POM88_015950 [Heracleum sosnowskyi]|uniref:Peptidase S9A N-terminal domain-containing protein n=1 Tax=Heracleum sosnowskyi TaxID=360622 RepID=A0AAD8IL41_9APIA|nr:hypothetical protein POM88_015950 [Heracleum sosnowskyi]
MKFHGFGDSIRRIVWMEFPKFCLIQMGSARTTRFQLTVMRIKDRMVEPDTLSWVKVSGISWTHDSRGFFYSRYLPPIEGKEFAAASKISAGTETNANLDHQLYCHFLGTDQSEDILCWRDPDNPKHTFIGSVTEDGKRLFVEASGTFKGWRMNT